MWLAVQKRLLTLDKLSTWTSVPITRTCSLCQNEEEDHAHLFFKCLYSCELLEQVNQWLQLHHVPLALNGWCHWIRHLAQNNSWRQRAKCAGYAAAVYHIWSERNARQHDSPNLSAHQRFLVLKREVLIWLEGYRGPLTQAEQGYLQQLKND